MVNKPSLRISVLKLLILHKRVSKTQALQLLGREDYGNISVVFHALLSDSLISESGKKINVKQGRPEILYKITWDGITYLFENCATTEDFWSSLAGLAYHRSNSIGWNKILELFEIYLGKHMKYYSSDGYYFFQLDFFNHACELWFEREIIKSGKMTPAQKILEVLANRPEVTLDEIAKISEENLQVIASTIKMYTIVPLKPVTVDVFGNSDGVAYDATDLEIHKAITESESSKGVKTFNLSLFGVLLVLFIIRKNDAGAVQQGLFYEHNIQQYFDIIAKNYKGKIPLIFGKWSLLKSTIQEVSCLNMDVITSKKTREEAFHDSIQDNGNREFYEAMKAIAIVSKKQFLELQTAGINVIFNYSPTEGYTTAPKFGIDRKDVLSRIGLVFYLMIYISSKGEPRSYDSESFFSLYGNDNYLGAEIAKQMSLFHRLDYLEKSLSLEITLIYYINLRRAFRYELALPSKFAISLKQNATKQHVLSNRTLIPPVQNLAVILASDIQIATFFNKYMTEFTKYFKEAYQLVVGISKTYTGDESVALS